MFYFIIASGSKGNATLVFTKEALFLIDMGIAISSLEDNLAKFNKSIRDIDGVFITHNHSDHIKNIKAFSPKKLYALKNSIPGSLANVMELNKGISIKDTTITPFKTSHDANNPCGYKFERNNESLVYMTDTGIFIEDNLELINDPTYLIIESNHDIKMLMNSNRPMILKKRILSDKGHLCNEDSAFATLSIIGNNTKEIVLAHLSAECNTPELALNAYKNAFEYKNIDLNNYNLRCANQYVPLLGGNYEN